MGASEANLYRYHCANLRSLDAAFKGTQLMARQAIRTGNPQLLFSETCVLAFLLAAWMEVRLQKLMYEPGAFQAAERVQVARGKTVIDRWLASVSVATKRAYGLKGRRRIAADTIPHSAFSRYVTITETLRTVFSRWSEVRNRLSHGQWQYPLNTNGDDVSPDLYKSIHDQNILEIAFSRQMVRAIADVIHDLAVSRQTFERDFDRHYATFINAKRNNENRSFIDYCAQIEEKQQRGVEQRRSGKQP